VLLAHALSGLSTWTPLYTLIAIFVLIVSSLEALGAGGNHPSRTGRALLRIPNSLERLTGIAGIGFGNDVAWHIYTGRDKHLFTAPHVMIVLGLTLIGVAALLGILFASLAGIDTALRYRSLRIPWSAASLGVLSATAVAGFPLDDLWHIRYGIDVTMWSPTHMLMIVGGSLAPLAAWLALGEAGVKPNDGPWARGVHATLAVLTLSAGTAWLTEYRYGVPQFQQLYHPILIAITAGFALVVARLVLGRGWAVLTAAIAFPLSFHLGKIANGPGFAQPRPVAVFIGSAIAVELVAWVAGTERKLRFALLSGLGVDTLGLAVEWWWNSHAIQPWRWELLRGALAWGTVAALGAAVIGAAFAGGVRRERTGWSGAVIAAAAVAVLVALAVPAPRRTGQVSARLAIQPVGDRALVTATLDPPGAANHAKWFQLMSWQGGGLVVTGLRQVSPGVWQADAAVPVTGKWKTLLRLQRSDQEMAVAIWMPADPTIPAPEIAAVSHTAQFLKESHFLLREQESGAPFDWFAASIDGLLLVIAAVWCASFVIVATRVRERAPLVSIA
jgi:hypothetical protein